MSIISYQSTSSSVYSLSEGSQIFAELLLEDIVCCRLRFVLRLSIVFCLLKSVTVLLSSAPVLSMPAMPSIILTNQLRWSLYSCCLIFIVMTRLILIVVCRLYDLVCFDLAWEWAALFANALDDLRLPFLFAIVLARDICDDLNSSSSIRL